MALERTPSLGKRLAEGALAELLDILDQFPHKTLVIDRALSPLVSAIAPFSALREHGVEEVSWLDSWKPRAHSPLIYLTLPDPVKISLLGAQIKDLVASGPAPDITVAVCPRYTPSCELLLGEAGVLGELTLRSWNAHFATVGPYLSLMLQAGGFDASIPESTLWASASAILDIQKQFGFVGHVSGFGARAKAVYELLVDGWNDKRAADATTGGFDYKFDPMLVSDQVDHLVLIDRQIDLVTPLLTQLTYQGLIDETHGIRPGGVVQMASGQKSQLGDNLFREIADLNFADVGRELNSVARQLQSEYEERHAAKTVTEMKSFVGRLGDLQTLQANLKVHTTMAEDLMSAVKTPVFGIVLRLQQSLLANDLSTSEACTQLQQLIYRGCDLAIALRLFSLICLCRGGIKERFIQTLAETILETYGYHHLPIIQSLQEKGLVFSRSDSTSYPALSRAFNLSNEEELGKMYAGFVPLITRLVQSCLGQNVGDTRLISNSFDEHLQSPLIKAAKLRKVLLRNTPGHEKPVLMVFVIGGLTYAEAASLNAINNLPTTPAKIIIASTGMITGNDLVLRA